MDMITAKIPRSTLGYANKNSLTSDGILISNDKLEQITVQTSSRLSTKEEIITEPTSHFSELELIKQIRNRNLSHWQHAVPNKESMSAAGWFSTNVNDRVICIYCDTICQSWNINDDPIEVHARLAPKCPFIRAMPSKAKSPEIVNDKFIEKFQPYHMAMAEVSRRQATFSKLTSTEDLPSIDDLVRAGFFYSGTCSIVTCFYCNGSLHKWSRNDNPMIEHARWFPSCTYAKHHCGNKVYNSIQASKKQLSKKYTTPNQAEISRFVASRLDLPIVQQLRSEYQIAIIKRCIEDQFKLKNDDFASGSDLKMACLILKKQIEIIKGCKDNIMVPSKSEQMETSIKSVPSSLGECFICLTEEKQLACMPCGHLCACVPCGYSLRSCPICRQKIDGFARINV